MSDYARLIVYIHVCVCVCMCVCCYWLCCVAAVQLKFASVQRMPHCDLHQAVGLVRYTFTKRENTANPHHPAICLSTCNLPLDSCHPLPKRP